MSNWTKFIPDGKGGYNSHSNWNLGNEIIYQGAWKIIFLLIFGIVFSTIIPVFVLLMYPFTDTRGQYENIIVGGLVSLIFLLDFWFGGLSWIFCETLIKNGVESGPSIHTWVACVNASLLVINIGLWFINHKVSPRVDMGDNTMFLFYLFIVVIIYWFLYPMFDSFLEGTRATEPIGFFKSIYTDVMSK
jgi:hypothetical protein